LGQTHMVTMTVSVMAPEGFAGAFCIFTSLCGFAWAVKCFGAVNACKIPSNKGEISKSVGEQTSLTVTASGSTTKVYKQLRLIYDKVEEGAQTFLF